MNFTNKLERIVKKNNSLVCVGLDSEMGKIPDRFKKEKYPQFAFNQFIIDQTHDLVCAYKPNSAFYEARGTEGINELKMTCEYLKEKHPEIAIILDAKRGDIGSTNEGYVTYAFDWLGVDAVTLHPYLGSEAIKPFLARAEKGCIILCRTSNPGAGEFQDLKIGNQSLYTIVAQHVVKNWNMNNNCLLVVGATYPTELAQVRKLVGNDMWFLVPGVGAQGGDIEKTVKAGRNSRGTGMIINSSRAIIFADNPTKETLKLQQAINKYRIKNQ